MLAMTLPNGVTSVVADEYAGRKQSFYVYGSDFAPIAASATVTNSIQIDADSDFIALAGVVTVGDAADTAVIGFPRFRVMISNTGSGRQYSNITLEIQNLFGSAAQPAWYTRPLIFPANSIVQVQVANPQAVVFNVRLAFWGFKAFLPGRVS